MSQRIQAVRGMNDLLPEQLALWQRVEAIMRRVLTGYGYREIRTPIIERTPLFERSIGEVTDIIEKEIYRFDDRSGESLALRPEGTAGCVRAGIEHGLLYNQEQRFWYSGPMFRYERPQKGRYRQFHQFGVEVFGLPGPDIDAELILLTAQLWRALGIDQQLRLQLNTIGTAAARVTYQKALFAYLKHYQHQLDAESQRRLQTNPLRLLDSKNELVQALMVEAPQFANYLDSATQAHFAGLCALLDAVQIPYQVNAHLVRGLDYYTGTVFEWLTDHLGTQNTVCGGGRYDGMVALLGGQGTPAIGFSIGLERLLLLIAQINSHLMCPDSVEVYLVSSGQGTLAASLCLADRIRAALPHLRIITHLGGGDFKKQFKRADKIGAQVVLVLGETELVTQQVVVKQLRTGMTQTMAQSAVIDYLQQRFNQ